MRRLAATAMLLLGVAAGESVQAQQLLDEAGVLSEQVVSETLTAEPSSDLNFALESGEAAPPYGMADECAAERVPTIRPVNWISGPYLRSGVEFQLSSDIFDVRQDTGWGISGGFRQPLGPEIGGDRFFFDLGGSYRNSNGVASPTLVDGQRVTTIANIVVDNVAISDAYRVSFSEVRRGSAHAAIGWFWGPGLDNRAWDPQVRIASRIGGRVGHARIDPKEQLLAPINTSTQTITPLYGRTDTYGGLFFGTEAILLQRQYSFGQFQWTVDGEIANDWIEFAAIREGSLGTASVMMGFMLSR